MFFKSTWLLRARDYKSTWLLRARDYKSMWLLRVRDYKSMWSLRARDYKSTWLFHLSLLVQSIGSTEGVVLRCCQGSAQAQADMVGKVQSKFHFWLQTNATHQMVLAQTETKRRITRQKKHKKEVPEITNLITRVVEKMPNEDESPFTPWFVTVCLIGPILGIRGAFWCRGNRRHCTQVWLQGVSLEVDGRVAWLPCKLYPLDRDGQLSR